jgi:hypothetical protein
MALNRENAQTRKEWPVVGVVNDQGAAHFSSQSDGVQS